MNFEIAKEKAIKYLVTAKKTEHEVRNKLIRESVDEDVIEDVIAYLLEINYINDNEYVDAYIKQCMRLLTYSMYEIKNKMLQKGIKEDIIDIRLEKLEESDYEDKLIQKLLKGKLKSMESIKQEQYLFRRGFKSAHNSDYNI